MAGPRPMPSEMFGGLARITDVGLGTTDGYGFVYRNGSLDILRFVDEGVAGHVAPTLSVTLNPLNDYRFVFILEGNVLTGEVFDLTNPGPAVATISGSDMDPSPFTTGVTGLLAAAGNDTSAADATFDNYNLAIPEPTGATLALLGLALFLRRRRQAPRRFQPSTCDPTPRDPAPPPRAHP